MIFPLLKGSVKGATLSPLPSHSISVADGVDLLPDSRGEKAKPTVIKRNYLNCCFWADESLSFCKQASRLPKNDCQVSSITSPFTLLFHQFSPPSSVLKFQMWRGVKFCSGADSPLDVVSGPHYWWTAPVWTDNPEVRSRGLTSLITTQILHST